MLWAEGTRSLLCQEKNYLFNFIFSVSFYNLINFANGDFSFDILHSTITHYFYFYCRIIVGVVECCGYISYEVSYFSVTTNEAVQIMYQSARMSHIVITCLPSFASDKDCVGAMVTTGGDVKDAEWLE